MVNEASAKRFLTDFYCRTLASVANRREQQSPPPTIWKFELPGVRLFLRDAVKRVSDVNLHIGLSALVEACANSEEEATHVGKAHVESVLNLVTLSTVAFCPPAELVSVLEMVKGRLPSLRQHCPLGERVEILASVAQIPQEVFGQIWNAYNRSPHTARAMRALSWLRKGISEENGTDEFAAYWIGLEVIKNLLRDKMRFRTRRPGEWDGVKEIFDAALGMGNFNDMKNARDGLLHGFRELDTQFAAEILSYVEPARRALILAIGNVLEVEEGVGRTLSEKGVRRTRLDPWTVLYGEVENLPENVESFISEYPQIETEIKGRMYQINEDGSVSIKVKATQRFRGPDSVRWRVEGSEQWGDRESGIKQIEFQRED